jgi:hypothetical protein
MKIPASLGWPDLQGMLLEERFVAQSKGHIELSFYTGCGACPYLLRFYCMCELRGECDVRD